MNFSVHGPNPALAGMLQCSKCQELKKDSEMLRCSRCKRTYYCNAACQRADWPAHKSGCKAPAAHTMVNAVAVKPGKWKTAEELRALVTPLTITCLDCGDEAAEEAEICDKAGFGPGSRVRYSNELKWYGKASHWWYYFLYLQPKPHKGDENVENFTVKTTCGGLGAIPKGTVVWIKSGPTDSCNDPAKFSPLVDVDAFVDDCVHHLTSVPSPAARFAEKERARMEAKGMGGGGGAAMSMQQMMMLRQFMMGGGAMPM